MTAPNREPREHHETIARQRQRKLFALFVRFVVPLRRAAWAADRELREHHELGAPRAQRQLFALFVRFVVRHGGHA